MKKISKLINLTVFSFVILVTAITFEGCSNSEASNTTEDNGIPVNVIEIEKERISFPIHVSGNISSNKESRLSFKTGGIIESIFVDEGDKVKKGQVLAKLDLKEIQEQVNQANIGLAKAQRDYNRVVDLYADSVATLEQLQNTKSALDLADASLNIANYNLQFSSIVAPEDGIILKKFFEKNEIVGTGMPIFYYASAQESWRLVIGVSDKDIVKLKIGDKANILTDAWPDKSLNCYVSKIANAPGQYTGLYEIEHLIEEPNLELKHGFFAKGEIFPSDLNDCFSLPIDAIQEGIGNRVMFYSVSGDKQFAIKQERNIVAITNDKVYINCDLLNDDMLIIVENQKELKHLDQIKIIESDWLAEK